MSLSYNFFIGPYLKCQYHLIDVSRDVFTCPNSTCESYGKDLEHAQYKFCPICGTELKSTSIIERESSVNIWDFTEQINERLCAAKVESDHYHYLISNIRDIPGIHLGQEVGTFIMSLTDVNGDWLVQQFEEVFKVEIVSAKAVYDVVEIEIGVLFWWN